MLAAQWCPTFCDPMDCSLTGSSVRGILQARILEWAAIHFSRRSSWSRVRPGSPALRADSLSSEPPSRKKWARALGTFIFHSGNSIEDWTFTPIHVRGESDSPCFRYLINGGLLKKHLTITPAVDITYSWKKLYFPDEVIIAVLMFSLTVPFSSVHFSLVTQSCLTLRPHGL